MKNKFLIWTLKFLSAVISFLLIFFFAQPFFIPKYLEDSTTIVKGYSYLEKDSIDVLFLGSSQMFCTVDSGKLSDEYGISSYDFGASGQTMSITPYYFDEAIKTQSPKLIMVEVCQIFATNKQISKQTLSWNYNPTDISTEKFFSLDSILSGDKIEAFKYTYAPLLLYHDRWSTLGDKNSKSKNDIDFVIHPEKYINFSSRGFLARDNVEPHKIAFYENDLTEKEIPEESKNAISYIAEQCKKNGIRLVFFKAPVSDWTKGDCNSVKSYMTESGIEYIDLNESLEIVGIDGNTDFYNIGHLNTSGAEKTTDYLATILLDYLK